MKEELTKDEQTTVFVLEHIRDIVNDLRYSDDELLIEKLLKIIDTEIKNIRG